MDLNKVFFCFFNKIFIVENFVYLVIKVSRVLLISSDIYVKNRNDIDQTPGSPTTLTNWGYSSMAQATNYLGIL